MRAALRRYQHVALAQDCAQHAPLLIADSFANIGNALGECILGDGYVIPDFGDNFVLADKPAGTERTSRISRGNPQGLTLARHFASTCNIPVYNCVAKDGWPKGEAPTFMAGLMEVRFLPRPPTSHWGDGGNAW
jgi:hypothetical protein